MGELIDYYVILSIVEHIDDIGRIHGTWGSYALIPEIDKYVIVEE